MTGLGRKSDASIQAHVEHLTRELAQTRAEQAAARDVLRVIARSPTGLQAVLDSIAERAVRVCGADGAVVHVVRDGRLRRVAFFGMPPRPADVESLPISREYLTGRAILDR